MATQQQGKFAYSIAEVAQLTSLGRTTIYEEIRSQRLRTTMVGRRRIITAQALREWLENSAAASGPPLRR